MEACGGLDDLALPGPADRFIQTLAGSDLDNLYEMANSYLSLRFTVVDLHRGQSLVDIQNHAAGASLKRRRYAGDSFDGH